MVHRAPKIHFYLPCSLKTAGSVFEISQKSVLNIAGTAIILDNLLHHEFAAAIRIDGVL